MGLVRLLREAPLWRQAAILGGLGTALVAITPSACTTPGSGPVSPGPSTPPGSGSYTSPGSTPTPAPPSPPQTLGTAPPGPAAGLTLVPSPSAPKPFVPPTIAPNSAIGPATILAPQTTPTPGFGAIRSAPPRPQSDTIPPRTMP